MIEYDQNTTGKINDEDDAMAGKRMGTKYILIFLIIIVSSALIYLRLPTPSYPEIPKETGAIVEERKENEPLDQFYSLMESAPISHSSFTIKPNFEEIKLTVTLNDPVEESQNAFYSWLAEAGYEDIPSDKFIFKSVK